MEPKEKWRQLARELGFEFKEGLSALTESPALLSMAGPQLKVKNYLQAREFLETPLVKTLLSRVFMGVASGTFQGYEFALLRGSKGSSGRSRHYTVNISLFFPRSLQADLKITGRGLGDALARLFKPDSYLSFPHNPGLNKLVAVKARNRQKTEAILADLDFQDKLAALYRYSHNFTANDHGIRYHEPGQIIAHDRARQIMDLMSAAAAAVV